MNKYSQYTSDRLETARRAKDLFRALAWAAAVCGAAALLVLGVGWVDRTWFLPKSIRFVSFLSLGLWLTLGIIRLAWMRRHPSDIKKIALDLEAKKPELGCAVSTIAEYLSGERKTGNEFEPEIVEALHELAAKELLLVETPYRRQFMKAGAFFTLALAGLVAWLVLTPALGTALQRVLAPWCDAAYTSVEVTPGNLDAPLGSDQEIVCRFKGLLPKSPRLFWREKGESRWKAAALTCSSDGACKHVFQSLSGDMCYQVSGNDALSPECEIKTFVPPQIKEVKVLARFPAYTKREPVEEHEPNLSVLRGSELRFHVAAEGDIARAQLRFGNAPAVDLTRWDDGGWSGSFTASKDALYWIELTDRAGRKAGNEKPFHLTVLPDEPPRVTIVEPGVDIRAEATNRVPIKIEVTDDFGIETLKLVFHKLGEPEQTISCAMTKKCPTAATAATEIDLAPLRLRDYELVSYFAEAQDNNTMDGPGIGRSPVYFIEITSKGKPLSQCQGGEKINILSMEKQVIAATSRAAANDEARLRDIAALQRQTTDYANIFKHGFLLSISPPEARQHFDAAIEQMQAAAQSLDKLDRDAGLAAEENALSRLYQAARLLPELESQCKGNSNCKKVVLEAIEKLKEQKKKNLQQGLPRIVRDVKALTEEQKRLEALYRALAAQTNAPAAEQKTPGSKSSPNPGAKAGEGAPQPPSLAQMADQQRKLGSEAARLEEQLRELAGKDPRVSHAYPQNMKRASSAMGKAAGAVAGRDMVDAMRWAGTSAMELDQVASGLEAVQKRNAGASDLADEEYPREFDALVSEYFRKLSHEE